MWDIFFPEKLHPHKNRSHAIFFADIFFAGSTTSPVSTFICIYISQLPIPFLIMGFSICLLGSFLGEGISFIFSTEHNLESSCSGFSCSTALLLFDFILASEFCLFSFRSLIFLMISSRLLAERSLP